MFAMERILLTVRHADTSARNTDTNCP
ncbi:hypothetical protein bas48_0221 [Escherichia phage CarlMeissner]|nr:hypothetical protein bas48_0221 [Escherichia phage CarlMeissner]